MPRYKVTIEFETDKTLRFPSDAQLLENMQVQLESLEDGDISDRYKVTCLPGSIQELKDEWDVGPKPKRPGDES